MQNFTTEPQTARTSLDGQISTVQASDASFEKNEVLPDSVPISSEKAEEKLIRNTRRTGEKNAVAVGESSGVCDEVDDLNITSAQSRNAKKKTVRTQSNERPLIKAEEVGD